MDEMERPTKRYRPHVPLDQRKRTVQACLTCRNTKRKCVPGTGNKCACCARSGQNCVFQRVSKDEINPKSPGPWMSKSANGDSCHSSVWSGITEDVFGKFRAAYPDNGLTSDQFSLLSGLLCTTINARMPSVLIESASHNENQPGDTSLLTGDDIRPESIGERSAPSTVGKWCQY